MTDSPVPAQLASHLGYWLRYVSNHVSHAFARKLAAENVTVAEWAALRTMFDTGQTAPNQLAARMGLTRGAISKLADRLVAKNLIERTDSGVDKRMHSLSLTVAGRALVPRLAALADINDAEFFDHLSVEDRETIERIMRGVVVRRGLNSIPLS